MFVHEVHRETIIGTFFDSMLIFKIKKREKAMRSIIPLLHINQLDFSLGMSVRTVCQRWFSLLFVLTVAILS